MNGTIAAPSTTLSRPKIHRPPALKPRPRLTLAFRRPVLLPFTVAVTALFAVMAIQRQVTGLTGGHAASLLPPVIVDASASVPPPEKSPQTLVIAGDTGTIVGRFVRVPADTRQITEIRPISAVDKEAARELLSIISRIN